ncbi:probable disease resistance protein At1g58602 [Ananas comosus]|uniref:Probable disease resistance protein At1g58602 n=1 Tax=Ananas comosus TaxID=4615 RepID=A0A6P5H3L5_ANACO|nr:probable disease resistance protein At1g58602 [Ananas comosus]XP_020114578.1 probable disease resistance protein At1g58602 [Ananas comosus]
MSEDALVSYIVNKIGDLFTQEISQIWKVADDVESLKQELQALEIFLNNMDYKQRRDAATKTWLSSVRDVAYEAEDLIDTYLLEKRYAPATRIFHSYSVYKQIEELKSKIHEIVERRTIYVPKLHEQRGEGSSSSAAADQGHLHPWRRSFPHLGDDVVVGFEHDADLLVERLLHSERRRQVVAITGMGGAGKTTLAAMVYNSVSKFPVSGHTHFTQLKEVDSVSELQNYFDVCAWVPVHQDPDIMDLLLIMIDQLGLSESTNTAKYEYSYQRRWKVHSLKQKLYWSLKQRRYLIVLDDIWRKEVWDQFKPALPNSGNGSRIIVTTRFKDVAIYHDPGSEPYEMRPLNEDDSWLLFLTKVFPQLTLHDQPICPRGLEDLGRQLSCKCAGLPLALVVLGGLVSTKLKHPLVWSKLLDNMNWDSIDDGKQCLEILALSYYDLPYRMKFCFLYLGAYPQGSDISASKLTKLWIGDDLIPKEEGITLEGTATNYLEELTQRCLVEIVKRGSDMSIKKVRVHDLLGELAKSEARESRFLQVANLNPIEAESKPKEIASRRLALRQIPARLPQVLCEKSRALLVFPASRINQIFTNSKGWFQKWLSNFINFYPFIYQPKTSMEFLRVLELEGLKPDSIYHFPIKDMTRLRYLGLRNSNFATLPFFGGIPPHLQTLDIRGTFITELPSEVWTLSELRHLYLNSMSLLDSQALRNMQTLSEAASAKSIRMSCMSLHNLQTLKIDADHDTPKTTDSKLVGYLKLLSSLNSLTLRTKEIPQEVFKATSTHTKLYKLKLDGNLQPDELCGIENFTRHITELTLSRSNLKGEPTKTLGQLKNLRILKLTDNACQCREISCSPGSFPNLSYLKLSNLSHLALLNMERGSFPNLMCLSIHCCTNMHVVPNGLNHITTLQVLKCDKMPFSFVEEINDWCRTHPMRVIFQDH